MNKLRRVLSFILLVFIFISSSGPAFAGSHDDIDFYINDIKLEEGKVVIMRGNLFRNRIKFDLGGLLEEATGKISVNMNIGKEGKLENIMGEIKDVKVNDTELEEDIDYELSGDMNNTSISFFKTDKLMGENHPLISYGFRHFVSKEENLELEIKISIDDQTRYTLRNEVNTSGESYDYENELDRIEELLEEKYIGVYELDIEEQLDEIKDELYLWIERMRSDGCYDKYRTRVSAIETRIIDVSTIMGMKYFDYIKLDIFRKRIDFLYRQDVSKLSQEDIEYINSYYYEYHDKERDYFISKIENYEDYPENDKQVDYILDEYMEIKYKLIEMKGNLDENNMKEKIEELDEEVDKQVGDGLTEEKIEDLKNKLEELEEDWNKLNPESQGNLQDLWDDLNEKIENLKLPPKTEDTDSGGIIIPWDDFIEKEKDKDKDEKEPDKDEKGIEHKAYIYGYEDMTIRPETSMSREEAAVILYRTMDLDKSRKDYSLKDLEGRWSYEELITLAGNRVVEGYPDESFRPTENISRGEVAAMLARILDPELSENTQYTDIDQHWARESINVLAEEGLIVADRNKEFKPDQEITRAEFIVTMNKVLKRDVSGIKERETKYLDLDQDAWYYKDIMEASIDHIHYEDGWLKEK